MNFWNYQLRKMWLDKCQESPGSENPSTNNVAKGQKCC